MSRKTPCTIFMSLLLSACGGGGGGDNSDSGPSTPEPTVLTGVFLDSPVNGLRYQTPTRSGLTNALGEFQYIDGENVTFSLGNTELGIARGTDTITPFTLLGIAPLTSEVEISNALGGSSVNSFDRAINIATLLQTFDTDGNPDNGIDLGSADTILKSDTINLLVKARTFENQAALALAKEKLQTTGNTSFGDAVKHLYQSLEVQVELKQIASFVSELDAQTSQSVNYQYDTNGNISAETTDLNNDGVADVNKTFSYDNSGNLLQITNSATNTTETLSYNASNLLLSRLIDKVADPDIQESYSYTDNKLSQFELDKGADGTIDSSTAYTYDANGNLSSYEIDKDGDGVADTTASYTYSGGLVSSFVEDKENDGIANLIIVYSYDENGNRISHNIDSTEGGEPKTLSTFEYDDNNNVIRYEQDQDLDGTTDYLEAYAYNQNNKRTAYRRDLNADGTWDVVAQYFYDTNGNRIRMIEDSDGNGIVDKVWTGNYQPAVLENGLDLILGKL